MAQDTLLRILASRKNGTTKGDFFAACQKFDLPVSEREWNKVNYLNKKNISLGLYNEGNRWYCDESYYYIALVKFVLENPKEKTDMGMAMGAVPSWIRDHHKTFISMFKLSDFNT